LHIRVTTPELEKLKNETMQCRALFRSSVFRATYRILNTDLSYCFAHFVLELMKILALMAGFNTI